MIKAVMPLIKKDKQIKFLMLGKGERYETSKRLIEELKLEKNILLLGKMPFEQLPNYIAAADICFALFDRTYPPFKKLDYYYSPIKIHEYKASGKPIIASNIGTLKNYVVNGKNGYSVNEGNIKEITEAVNKLLTQKKKAQKIGQTNRKEIMTTYNWEVQSKRLLKELYGN
jgi:glycosyltransferase involved in cell wall biosynthesis